MEKKLEELIKRLAMKAGETDKSSTEAQQYAQAILNAAHALVTLKVNN